MICKNPRCRDRLNHRPVVMPLCVSCRYVARWAFAVGAGVVGAAWGVLRLLQ